MREKRSQMFNRLSSIFVKSIRNLTEVKETEKFMLAKMREFGKGSYHVK